MKNRLHKCCMCGETATWRKDMAMRGDAIYYCHKCVPRGDVSNVENIEEWGEPQKDALVMWWDSNAVKKDLEKDGSTTRTADSFYYEYLTCDCKRSPSIKFSNDINGFPIKTKKEATITCDEIMDSYNKHKLILKPMELKLVSNSFAEVILNYESVQLLPYNTFMSQIGDRLTKKVLTIGYKNNINKFYHRFKSDMAKAKYVKG